MIRPATAHDVPAIRALILELATFERAAEQVRATDDQLATALFGPQPRVHAHVAVVAGEVVGFALWFLNFSTWRGTHGIYLEDLYVRASHRRSGLGQALLATLAQICLDSGYARMDWWVLNWNESAHGFYDSLGAVPMAEWTVWRLTDDALTRLAASTQPSDSVA